MAETAREAHARRTARNKARLADRQRRAAGGKAKTVAENTAANKQFLPPDKAKMGKKRAPMLTGATPAKPKTASKTVKPSKKKTAYKSADKSGYKTFKPSKKKSPSKPSKIASYTTPLRGSADKSKTLALIASRKGRGRTGSWTSSTTQIGTDLALSRRGGALASPITHQGGMQSLVESTTPGKSVGHARASMRRSSLASVAGGATLGAAGAKAPVKFVGTGETAEPTPTDQIGPEEQIIPIAPRLNPRGGTEGVSVGEGRPGRTVEGGNFGKTGIGSRNLTDVGGAREVYSPINRGYAGRAASDPRFVSAYGRGGGDDASAPMVSIPGERTTLAGPGYTPPTGEGTSVRDSIRAGVEGFLNPTKPNPSVGGVSAGMEYAKSNPMTPGFQRGPLTGRTPSTYGPTFSRAGRDVRASRRMRARPSSTRR